MTGRYPSGSMKFLIKLLLVGLVGLFFLGLAAKLTLAPATRAGVEKGAGSALGVGASLADVTAGLGLGSSSIGLSGLAFESPKEFPDAPLLDVGEASVDVGTFSLLSDTIRVPSIRLDGLRLHILQDGTRSNLRPILDRIRNAGAGESEQAAEEEGKEKGSSKKLSFGTVSVSGVGVSLSLKGVPGLEEKNYNWTAPAFELDLSDEANQARVDSIEDLAQRLVEELAQRGMEAAGGSLPPEVSTVIQGDLSLKGATDALLKQAEGKLGEKVQGELDGVLDGKLDGVLDGKLDGALDGLFGGKKK